MNKPFSESCVQNRAPILARLETLLAQHHAVLEIGSGTGQHAVYFAPSLSWLQWYCSDVVAHHAGIQQWLDEAALPNVHAPLPLDVTQNDWHVPEVIDAIFSANTTHIMHWQAVEALFAGVGARLPANGIFILYGPFNYDNQYTSQSNARFDAWLKARDAASGIRDFTDLNQLASQANMTLEDDIAMPANNRILCWKKQSC